ncbi:hypothetical protein KUC69_30985 [Pseudomonas aeruginosa]|uniref:hypothetical protein n=1 Tax=Pseudomonas aeruginosa TaxID=287 RepID=UPI0021E2EDD3|nr:hypothetical protein [Pseudomonas aeruginosa]MCV0062827.1 hypothetical protein [Pseudomonas aeruginosa]
MTVHGPLIPTQEDLFHEEVSLLLPERFVINCKVLNNPVRQLARPETRELCRLRPFSLRQIAGYEATLPSGEILRIINTKTSAQLNVDLVLLVPGASDPAEISLALERGEGRWVANAMIDLSMLDAAARNARLKAITASWDDAFLLRESRPAKDGLK